MREIILRLILFSSGVLMLDQEEENEFLVSTITHANPLLDGTPGYIKVLSIKIDDDNQSIHYGFKCKCVNVAPAQDWEPAWLNMMDSNDLILAKFMNTVMMAEAEVQAE